MDALRRHLRRFRHVAGVALALVACSGVATAADTVDLDAWRAPPPSARPYVRWWWPGGAVDGVEIERELQELRAQGFGGVEVQPFRISLSDADTDADPAVRTVGTPAFFATLRATIAAARAAGLGIDVNFGSGWPLGSSAVPTATNSRQLLLSSVEVTGPARFDEPLPAATEPRFTQRPAQRPIDPTCGDSCSTVGGTTGPGCHSAAWPAVRRSPSSSRMRRTLAGGAGGVRPHRRFHPPAEMVEPRDGRPLGSVNFCHIKARTLLKRGHLP